MPKKKVAVEGHTLPALSEALVKKFSEAYRWEIEQQVSQLKTRALQPGIEPKDQQLCMQRASALENLAFDEWVLSVLASYSQRLLSQREEIQMQQALQAEISKDTDVNG